METEPMIFALDPVTEAAYPGVLEEVQMHTIHRYLATILRSLPPDPDPRIRENIIREVVANGPGRLHSY